MRGLKANSDSTKCQMDRDSRSFPMDSDDDDDDDECFIPFCKTTNKEDCSCSECWDNFKISEDGKSCSNNDHMRNECNIPDCQFSREIANRCTCLMCNSLYEVSSDRKSCVKSDKKRGSPKYDRFNRDDDDIEEMMKGLENSDDDEDYKEMIRKMKERRDIGRDS